MMLKTVYVAAAAVTLLLLAPACGPGGADTAGTPSGGAVTILQPDPVAGWMNVDTPGPVAAMEADHQGVRLLGGSGLLLTWSRETGVWSPAWIEGAEEAFDVTLLDGVPVLLTPSRLILVSNGTGEMHLFGNGSPSLDIDAGNGELLVLFNDGSAVLNPHSESPESFQASGPAPSGGLLRAGEDWAWINTDGTLSLLDSRIGLRRNESLPQGVNVLAHGEMGLFSGDGSTVFLRVAPDEWVEHCAGSLHSSGLILSETGVGSVDGDAPVAGRFPEPPRMICSSGSSPVWALTDSGLYVWAELEQVETRLPTYDLARIQCSLAGQTGGQTAGGVSGVSSSSVSVSGVFRIYESVSSRPDPFTEFPASRRDLRRSLADLTIEELHLVGITLDPSGGDQAMVEDANGVAYILQEGTRLANNTHIAEITSNEVIVVQEVTVGSMMPGGTVTSIPTIYSMRLHEEGGF